MNMLFINPSRVEPSCHLRAMNGSPPVNLSGEKAYDGWSEPDGCASRDYTVEGGIAVIPVHGTLVSAQIPCWFYYGDLTYENLTATIARAIEDASVRSVVLQINSPGGTVTGCAEAAALIDGYAKIKPIVASCSMADSAAYWLASACNEITVDPTGEVGSIGVICSHTDYSKLLEEWGIKTTLIFSGSHKADGSPYDPLTPEAKQSIQAEMDYLRGIFVASVAAMRGMSPDDVSATEALTYKGEQAVEKGLADNSQFHHQTMADMAGHLTTLATVTQENEKMAKNPLKKPTKAATPKNPAEAEAELKPAAAAAADDGEGDDETDGEDDEDPKKKDEGDDEGDGSDEAAATKERGRIDAILSAPEAKGRQALAQHLALKTNMPSAAAVDVLKASPEEKTESLLATGMRGIRQPAIGANTDPAATTNPVADHIKKKFAVK